MQALNHVAFGTLLAVTLKQPALVVPIALASHFAMDVLPHYGEDSKAPRGSAPYHFRILIDGLASLIFVGVFSSRFPEYSGVIMLGALFAVFPDFFWPLALYIKRSNPIWKFLRFHKQIQKFESPKGIYNEVVWFIATLLIISAVRLNSS